MNAKALIIPGIGNSGPDHWQSYWEKANPLFTRVRQRDWDRPVCKEWVDALDRALDMVGSDALLVAHSLGCLVVAHWTEMTRREVRGALLVAPPNTEGPAFPQSAVGFAPVPVAKLPFPSIVVASTDDPYGSIGHARSLAGAWGSRFISIGSAGHINSDSRLGNWDAGFALLGSLIA